jgi:hypothetical protein
MPFSAKTSPTSSQSSPSTVKESTPLWLRPDASYHSRTARRGGTMTWEWIVILFLWLAVGGLKKQIERLQKDNLDLLTRVYNIERLLVGKSGSVMIEGILAKHDLDSEEVYFQIKELKSEINNINFDLNTNRKI